MCILGRKSHLYSIRASCVHLEGLTWVHWHADWVEHVIDTKGDPYLKTPEDELSFIVRNSLDVYAIVAVCCCVMVLVASATLLLLVNRLGPMLGACLNEDRFHWRHMMPKRKAN